METKICSKCKIEKSLNEFHKNRSECKECKKEYDLSYKNKIKNLHLKEKKCTICKIIKFIKYFSKGQSRCKDCNRIYRIENKDKIRESNKKYIKNNKEKIKLYRIENKDKIKKYNNLYRIENKDKIKKNHKIFYSNNNKEICKIKKEFRKKNTCNYLIVEAKKRAKKQNIDFNITADYIKTIFPKNNKCPFLNILIKVNDNIQKDNSITIDRIDNNKGYIKDNVLLLSLKANRSKSNSTIEEYERIVNNLENIKINYDNNNNFLNFKRLCIRKKYESKKKTIDFNLTEEYLKSIYPKNNKCPLLNIEFKQGKNIPQAPTLDKINPKLGYIKENVIFVSRKANTIKNNLTLEEMKLLLKNWKKFYNPNNSIISFGDTSV